MVCLLLLSLAAYGGASKRSEEDKSMKLYKISTILHFLLVANNYTNNTDNNYHLHKQNFNY